MSESNFPLGWSDAENLIKTLSEAGGVESTKAAVNAMYDVHAAKFRESPNGDNFFKLSMTMCAMQVLRNENHK